jgi:hypothetical protein
MENLNETNTKPTHTIKPEVKTNPELAKAYEELVTIHQNYTDQISYIGSLVTENDEEVMEQNEMLVNILKQRYDVALYIIQTFYDKVDEAGNIVDKDGFITVD